MMRNEFSKVKLMQKMHVRVSIEKIIIRLWKAILNNI